MTDLPKLFFDAIKSGKVYVVSIGVTAGLVVLSPWNWEPLKDQSRAKFWFAIAFVFCCTFLACSLVETMWIIFKNKYVTGTINRKLKGKLKRLHPVEKEVLLMFANTRERFLTISVPEAETDIGQHLSHLHTHRLIVEYYGITGPYRAAGPVAYQCQISDRLWDLFADMSLIQIQRLLD